MESSRRILPSKKIDTAPSGGLARAASPEAGDTDVLTMLRLDLAAGETYPLESGALEMCGMVVSGGVTLSGAAEGKLSKYDAWYIPGGRRLEITAESGAVLYIASAVCKGMGKAKVSKFTPDAPAGELRQVHGAGCCRRDVYFSLPEKDPASRLLCGVVFGETGGWTGWPPHQHEEAMEEVYWYFDYPEGEAAGLQLHYPTGGRIRDADAFVMQNGSLFVIGSGYHPTVAMPGARNVYFWALASYSHETRKFSQSVADPLFTG